MFPNGRVLAFWILGTRDLDIWIWGGKKQEVVGHAGEVCGRASSIGRRAFRPHVQTFLETRRAHAHCHVQCAKERLRWGTRAKGAGTDRPRRKRWQCQMPDRGPPINSPQPRSPVALATSELLDVLPAHHDLQSHRRPRLRTEVSPAVAAQRTGLMR